MLEAGKVFNAKESEEERIAEAKKILENNRAQYRNIIAKLQEDEPECFKDMPGFTLVDLNERERSIVEDMSKVNYSKRYQDSKYEYRHVILPKGILRWLPVPMRLMTESEWRSLGVIQSPGWTHYMIHEPEPHVLLFKREKEIQKDAKN